MISIGPDAEGVIPPETEQKMLELGKWTGKYAEAIYPTQKGLDSAYFQGGSTLSKDEKTLYLFMYDKPERYTMLNGIRNKNMKITSLASGRELKYNIIGGAPWVNMPGQIWVETEKSDFDDICTVLKVEFEEKIDLVSLDSENVNSVGGAE